MREGPGARSEFPTTRWSIVLAASDRGSSQNDSATREALEWLCERYWQPLYLYACGRCPDRERARDLTQEFIATLLERHWLDRADPERGRFRSFLLISLKRFLADQYDHERAQKRGGGQIAVELDSSGSEERSPREIVVEANPETLYERQWAITLVERVVNGLRDHFQRSGGTAQFEMLKPYLIEDDGDYQQTSVALGMSLGATRIAVHRLRKLFQKRFREEIAETVSSAAEVDGEIRYLLNALSDSPGGIARQWTR